MILALIVLFGIIVLFGTIFNTIYCTLIEGTAQAGHAHQYKIRKPAGILGQPDRCPSQLMVQLRNDCINFSFILYLTVWSIEPQLCSC